MLRVARRRRSWEEWVRQPSRRPTAGSPGAVDDTEEVRFRSVLAVPLVLDDRPIGALNVQTAEPRDYSAEEIDMLAQLMQRPDDNFHQLKNIWETKKEFRLVKGGLI